MKLILAAILAAFAVSASAKNYAGHYEMSAEWQASFPAVTDEGLGAGTGGGDAQ